MGKETKFKKERNLKKFTKKYSVKIEKNIDGKTSLSI